MFLSSTEARACTCRTNGVEWNLDLDYPPFSGEPSSPYTQSHALSLFTWNLLWNFDHCHFIVLYYMFIDYMQ